MKIASAFLIKYTVFSVPYAKGCQLYPLTKPTLSAYLESVTHSHISVSYKEIIEKIKATKNDIPDNEV